MNREIKFRIWANTNDGLKMIYLDTFKFDNGLWFQSDEHVDEYEETIMQFTGLKDKNGKEIYEGDILVKDEHKWKVIWDNKRAAFALWRISPDKRYFDGRIQAPMAMQEYLICETEVIGNIYENPELLK